MTAEQELELTEEKLEAIAEYLFEKLYSGGPGEALEEVRHLEFQGAFKDNLELLGVEVTEGPYYDLYRREFRVKAMIDSQKVPREEEVPRDLKPLWKEIHWLLLARWGLEEVHELAEAVRGGWMEGQQRKILDALANLEAHPWHTVSKDAQELRRLLRVLDLADPEEGAPEVEERAERLVEEIEQECEENPDLCRQLAEAVGYDYRKDLEVVEIDTERCSEEDLDEDLCREINRYGLALAEEVIDRKLQKEEVEWLIENWPELEETFKKL